MKLAYDFTDIASIEPVMTREFDNFEEMKTYLHSVSKIAIKRAFPFIFDIEVPYSPTKRLWNSMAKPDQKSGLRDAVVTTFGQEIECQDRQKRVAFRMKLAYDFTVIASIEPVMTRKFDNFEEIIME